ncbi:hypothetical protein MYXO_01996 [Myxococcaceae bacterium]|jgi:hypothetical protein|nr:hypothetical protein MYXO_01996 [Myxococcaceae bacterium]
MSEKPSRDVRDADAEVVELDELRRELERCGVSADLVERLAGDLTRLAGSLGPEATRGALAGVALASAAHRERTESFRRGREDLGEIERLMSAFASELAKVDEAVKLLSAFVGRIREQSACEGDRILH